MVGLPVISSTFLAPDAAHAAATGLNGLMACPSASTCKVKVPANSAILVELWGGGGGGGGGRPTQNEFGTGSGGGGGAGGYVRSIIHNVGSDADGIVTVTITTGTGGAGGADGTDGAAGTSTKVSVNGILVEAYGGLGGKTLGDGGAGGGGLPALLVSSPGTADQGGAFARAGAPGGFANPNPGVGGTQAFPAPVDGQASGGAGGLGHGDYVLPCKPGYGGAAIISW
jgi:hypothetical protein